MPKPASTGVRPHWSQFLRGNKKTPGEMNGTERAYSEHLEGLRVLGQIEWFSYESISLKIGNGASYRPDFVVMTSTGFLELHEVKGFWTDAARVRIKVAAMLFPFRFIAVQKIPKKAGGGWREEEF